MDDTPRTSGGDADTDLLTRRQDGSERIDVETAAGLDRPLPAADRAKRRPPAPAPTPGSPGARARPALPQIYEECFGYVWTCLKRLGVWERDLEDATHDVFLVVHRRLPDYDPERPLKPWLAGIATRVASEFRRRAQHRRETLSEDGEMENTSATPSRGVPAADVAFVDKQRRDLVLRALERLDFDRRSVLVLHDIEGHAMPEVAVALDANVNTLYARLRAARLDFAAAVKAIAGDGARTFGEGA
jgi:RNA polymerase sigma-70 factor, ECF subfamily